MNTGSSVGPDDVRFSERRPECTIQLILLVPKLGRHKCVGESLIADKNPSKSIVFGDGGSFSPAEYIGGIRDLNLQTCILFTLDAKHSPRQLSTDSPIQKTQPTSARITKQHSTTQHNTTQQHIHSLCLEQVFLRCSLRGRRQRQSPSQAPISTVPISTCLPLPPSTRTGHCPSLPRRLPVSSSVSKTPAPRWRPPTK